MQKLVGGQCGHGLPWGLPTSPLELDPKELFPKLHQKGKGLFREVCASIDNHTGQVMLSGSSTWRRPVTGWRTSGRRAPCSASQRSSPRHLLPWLPPEELEAVNSGSSFTLDLLKVGPLKETYISRISWRMPKGPASPALGRQGPPRHQSLQCCLSKVTCS